MVFKRKRKRIRDIRMNTWKTMEINANGQLENTKARTWRTVIENKALTKWNHKPMISKNQEHMKHEHTHIYIYNDIVFKIVKNDQ